METITYNLRNKNGNSVEFYENLGNFTDYLLNANEFDLSYEIKNFAKFQHKFHSKTTPLDEIFFEILTMGVLMEENAKKALGSKKIARSLAKLLYRLRKKNGKFKPQIDKIRGYISTLFLTKEGNKKYIQTKNEFMVFIDWLMATGEYRKEATKLLAWAEFFKQLTHAEIAFYLSKAYSIAGIFKKEAIKWLGQYTEEVNIFLNKELQDRKYKEDYIFCGKSEVEYHLNMVGAEIMNRNLKPNFEKTSKKILLLPTCMCQPEDGDCMAFNINNKLYCTGCSEKCNINKYKKYCQQNGMMVNLIPHSTSFTKYLKEWQDQKDVGLIGVACVPNLLTGGYEMKELDIPSQCIFLDYCGCKKHWHKKGIATDIDINSLEKMALDESYKTLITTFS